MEAVNRPSLIKRVLNTDLLPKVESGVSESLVGESSLSG